MFAVSELEIIHVCSYSPLCLSLPEMFLFSMSALKALLRKLKNSNHQPILQIWLTYNYIKRFNPAIVCDCPKSEPGYLTSSLTTQTSLSPIWRGFASGFVNNKKGCSRLAAASDKVYQLFTHGRWFPTGTPASSTSKTGDHDIAEILLIVAWITKNQKIKSVLSWLLCSSQ